MDLIDEPDRIFDVEIAVPDEMTRRELRDRIYDEIRYDFNGQSVRLIDKRGNGSHDAYVVVRYGDVTPMTRQYENITQAVFEVTDHLKEIKEEYANEQ